MNWLSDRSLEILKDASSKEVHLFSWDFLENLKVLLTSNAKDSMTYLIRQEDKYAFQSILLNRILLTNFGTTAEIFKKNEAMLEELCRRVSYCLMERDAAVSAFQASLSERGFPVTALTGYEHGHEILAIVEVLLWTVHHDSVLVEMYSADPKCKEKPVMPKLSELTRVILKFRTFLDKSIRDAASVAALRNGGGDDLSVPKRKKTSPVRSSDSFNTPPRKQRSGKSPKGSAEVADISDGPTTVVQDVPSDSATASVNEVELRDTNTNARTDATGKESEERIENDFSRKGSLRLRSGNSLCVDETPQKERDGSRLETVAMTTELSRGGVVIQNRDWRHWWAAEAESEALPSFKSLKGTVALMIFDPSPFPLKGDLQSIAQVTSELLRDGGAAVFFSPPLLLGACAKSLTKYKLTVEDAVLTVVKGEKYAKRRGGKKPAHLNNGK